MSTSPHPTVVVETTTTVGSFTVSASFSTGPGITALFGPSGAGKSVTMATIAGLLRPAQGHISLVGETVADATTGRHVPTQDRGLGMVFQDAALLAHRSPVDNVGLAVRGADRAERRRRSRQWLEQVEAGHLAHSPTATLSGGEQQRIAVARALAGEPRILLLDEPFSALDRDTRSTLRALLRQIVDDHGITALLVTHDLDDIVDLADRVVLYEPGRTLAVHDLPPSGRDRISDLLRPTR